jgi:hypothetical protein
MRNSKHSSRRWVALFFAAFMVLGLARVGPAQTDVTKTRVAGNIRDVDGGVLPGATVVVKTLQKPLGGT